MFSSTRVSPRPRPECGRAPACAGGLAGGREGERASVRARAGAGVGVRRCVRS